MAAATKPALRASERDPILKGRGSETRRPYSVFRDGYGAGPRDGTRYCTQRRCDAPQHNPGLSCFDNSGCLGVYQPSYRLPITCLT